MENLNITVLIINFLITAFFYMILPIISLFIDKKGYEKKELVTFIIGNSFLVYVIFFVIHIFKKDGQVPNMYSSVLYGFLNYALLHKNVKVNEKETQKKDNINKTEISKEEVN